MERSPAVISAIAVLASGVVIFAWIEPGPLSMQMAQHVFVMNIAAPLVAAALPAREAGRSFLWPAALAQIVLLWAFHAPPAQHSAAASHAVHLLMLGALTGAAILFWAAVLAATARHRWGPILALLATGKLACLLGALLIFAPNTLYRLSTIEDQQLAGLLMVSACPLSYLVAGVVLAARALARLEKTAPPQVAR